MSKNIFFASSARMIFGCRMMRAVARHARPKGVPKRAEREARMIFGCRMMRAVARHARPKGVPKRAEREARIFCECRQVVRHMVFGCREIMRRLCDNRHGNGHSYGHSNGAVNAPQSNAVFDMSQGNATLLYCVSPRTQGGKPHYGIFSCNQHGGIIK